METLYGREPFREIQVISSAWNIEPDSSRGNRITRYCVLQSLRRKRGQIL